MKTKVLIFSTFIWANLFIHAQIRSDFILTDQGVYPHIVVDRQNHLHAAWGNLRENSVYYALFDSLGNPITASYKIRKGDQWPRLSVNEKYAVTVWGGITVSWTAPIFCQLFSINGEPISDPVKFTDQGWIPDVCFLNDSTFVVVWYGEDPDTCGVYGVYGQIITTLLKPIGETLLLSGHKFQKRSYVYPRVLNCSENGNFIVIWLEGENQKIFGRIFSSDGTPQDSSFLISEDMKVSEISYFDATMGPSGDFAIVWGSAQDSLWQIQWRWFRSNGSPLGPSVSITAETDKVVDCPCVDIDLDGKCVVVWEEEENSCSRIYAQRFLPDRTPLGDSFRVSTRIDTFNQMFPSVVLHRGKIYTVWEELQPSSLNDTIWANIIDFNNPPTDVESIPNRLPEIFRLHQNYPNPFNQTTTIIYEVKQRSHIRFVIYNVLGEEIFMLENREVMPGIHELRWNGKDSKGGDVPSGVYIYKLTVDGNTQMKKMLLLR